jgi:hypothetical protein
MSAIKWSYGVTTVAQRKVDLLPRTLESLKKTGFGEPILFVDGLENGSDYSEFGLPVVPRGKRNIKTFGNWVLSLWELYLRQPEAKFYAIFQDDFVAGLNLRTYLEKCDYPDRGYWNLYTFPENEEPEYKTEGVTKILRPPNYEGWYESNQLGKGAVGLVFSYPAVQTLLMSLHMIERVKNPRKGCSGVDGGVVTAMNKFGFKEYVHFPSLIQHTGIQSSMGSKKHPLARSLRGEDYNYLELLK